MMRNAPYFTVIASGTTVTSGAASASTAIPNDSSGKTARKILVTVATASGFAFVKPGPAGVTASSADLCINFGAPILLNVRGASNIAYIQGSTSCVLVFTPLEDA